MASFEKVKNGYRAHVYVHGQRKSKTFPTRREANAWAAALEMELSTESESRYTLGDAIIRYRDEVTPTKRGKHWEFIRLQAFLNDQAFPSKIKIGRVTPEVLGRWRNLRALSVSAGTIIREFGLLSAVFEVARREWRWVSTNPCRDVRKPPSPRHREITIQPSQIKAMLRALGYSPNLPVREIRQSVAVCFLLALRTGMRAGELCGLEWTRVKDSYCRLPTTKTVPRDVPLSSKAIRVLNKMRGWDNSSVFGLKPQTLDAVFRKYRERSGLSGFTFHDSRHTAATMLSKKVDVLTLCKIFGWSDPKQAMVYYNPKASDIAKMLG